MLYKLNGNWVGSTDIRLTYLTKMHCPQCSNYLDEADSGWDSTKKINVRDLSILFALRSCACASRAGEPLPLVRQWVLQLSLHVLERQRCCGSSLRLRVSYCDSTCQSLWPFGWRLITILTINAERLYSCSLKKNQMSYSRFHNLFKNSKWNRARTFCRFAMAV
jgi:hypothetical protein